MPDTIIELKHIHKSYQKQAVLKDLHFRAEKGDFIAITGASGCGKSTLLNIIGLLERPEQGETIHFGLQNIKPFSQNAQRLLRTKIGYLFQNYALLENKTVEYNLNLVFDYKTKKHEKEEKIEHALRTVGLSGMNDKKVCQCSGGEQQRIALARLLIKPCDLILADEPTGNLDFQNKELVFGLLKKLCGQGKTIILVTHDMQLAQCCNTHFCLLDGRLLSENKGCQTYLNMKQDTIIGR